MLVRGRAVVEEPPGREWREQLAIHYLGEEGGRRYIAENAQADDVMLRIVPERVRGW